VGAESSGCSTGLQYVEDSTPPERRSAPDRRPRSLRGRTRASSSRRATGSRFACHLHEPGFQPCVSPATYPALPAGARGRSPPRGAAGNDRLTDHNGRDVFSGGAGNETIDARDTTLAGRRARDTVRCAAGTRDVALVDRRDLVLRDCERIARR
jgi:hypothetical protein